MNKKILLFLGILFACLIFTQKSQGALGNVVLLSPANGAVINFFDIELSWKPVDGAKSYKYQTMSNNAVIESGITTSTTIKLDKNKAYFNINNNVVWWKVFPCNDIGGSDCSSAVIGNHFFVVFSQPIFPNNVNINNPIVATLKKVQGAGSYKYEITQNGQKTTTSIINASGSSKYVIDYGDYFLWYIKFDSNHKIDWNMRNEIIFYACIDNNGSNCPNAALTKIFFNFSKTSFYIKDNNSVGTYYSKLKEGLDESLLPCKKPLGFSGSLVDASKACAPIKEAKGTSMSWRQNYKCFDPCTPNLALSANFALSFAYNLFLSDRITNGIYNNTPTIGINDELKINLESPEGEWIFSGGYHDTPPIIWIEDAVKDFKSFKDIPNLYEYKYDISHLPVYNEWLFRSRAIPGYTIDKIIKPKLGIAATDPLINKKISVLAQESDRVSISYDQNGNPIIKALKPGIVHLTAKIPEMPTYQTIDNIWFDNGSIPEYSQNFTIIIDGNKKPKIVIGNFKAPPQVLDLKVDNIDYCAFDPSIRFNWKFSDPDSVNGDTQSNYQIQVSLDPSFSNLIIDKKVLGSSQSYLAKFSDGFEYGKTYYWRMKLWDSQTPDQNESQWVIAENNLTTPDKPYPAVDFDFREELIDKKATFIFENKTDTRGEEVSYRWEFGDGQSSNAENPSHIYALPDNYEVILSAKTKFGTECKKIKPLAPEGDLEFQDSPVDLLNF